MTGTYILSALAQRDLDDIIAGVEVHSRRAAEEFEDEMASLLETLAGNPGIGTVRPALTDKPVRFKLFRKRYFVIYQDGPPVRIVRVLMAHRDLVALLEGPL